MMTKNADKKREQMQMFCMDDMVPKDHMLRLIDRAINWNFIYELVEDKYCTDNGRPSMDPVMLIKIPFIQYLYGIKSMRQTIKEIEVNVAYRWFLGYSIHPGNEHDSRTFKELYDKILKFNPKMLIMDAGYKTPAIAHELIENGIQPLFPYKRPQTKEGFFKKYEYAYDEYYDCYICPNNKILSYKTTNRDGYREYKSNCEDCRTCPLISMCTESKDHVKLITRHVWEDYLEICEDIRCTLGNKEIYQQRKETIERLFGTAKEQHGFRYTQQIGKTRMEMKVGLTYACMNLKKLAKILANREDISSLIRSFSNLFALISINLPQNEMWCRS